MAATAQRPPMASTALRPQPPQTNVVSAPKPAGYRVPNAQAALQKPPGYRDANASAELRKPPGYRDPNAPGLPPRPPSRRKPPPPVYPRKRRRRPPPRRRRCCGCCCWCMILLILVFAAAIGGAACYLYFHPQLPTFHLQSVKVNRLQVEARPEGTFVDAAAKAAVRVRNPSGRLGVGYGEWELTMRLEGVKIGTGRVGGFDQGRKNSTVVTVGVVGRGVMVEDDGAGVRLNEKYKNKDARLEVVVKTRFGLEGTGVRVPIKVVCGGVRLKDLQLQGKNAERSAVLPPKCSIYVLRWMATKLRTGINFESSTKRDCNE